MVEFFGMGETTYDGYADIAARVESARRAWSRTHVAENLCKFVTLFGGALLAMTLLASAGTPPGTVRWMMLGALVLLLFITAVRFVFRPLFQDWTDEEVAVHVERRFPEFDNAVINTLQLARDPMVRELGIVGRMIRRAERDTRGVPFARAIDRSRLKRYALTGALVLAGLAIYAFAFGGAFSRAMQRILMPAAYVPEVGSAHIFEVKPGSATVVVGDPLRVLARYRRIGGGEIDGTITYAPGNSTAVRRSMKPLAADQFMFAFPEVRAPFTYQVNIGGTESDVYHIRVTERPAVTRIDIEYELPSYTRLAPARENDSNGDLKALAGTLARLTLTTNKAVRSGAIEGYLDGTTPLTIDPNNPRRLSGQVRITQSGSYTIRIRDHQGNPNRSPVIHRVTALPDLRPTVALTVPGKNIAAQPGDKVHIAFAAKDDYGILIAELIARREHSKSEGTAIARWTTFADSRNVQNTHALLLDRKEYKPGDVLEYWVTVTDSRCVSGTAAGQQAKTPPYLIRIEDKKKVAEEKVKNLQRWQEAVRKVLDKEIAIRKTTRAMSQIADLAQFAQLTAGVTKDQTVARLAVLRIANDIKPTEAHIRRVKEFLYRLAANEMVQAVKLGEAVTKAGPLPDRKARLKAFGGEVDNIIEQLQKLLDVLPRLEEQAKKESDDDEGFDLSEDAKEKLKELDRGLKDFIDEQKKVIDASQELAQKNVDDFTKEDDKKLKELAATEDKWSQFFKEKHHDLSKLPEQDLANSTLLKELLEVQSEVQMAKDALAKKSKEIATAIEDNGLELAKKLETHIEKWLPDTPDRDKWKMEEVLGQEEAPMAELPKELEDLVGDLMEEEEDLMEEVEDATAGYADSLDKGAGWDAMDGPISNMSAQGVTGNRLPNKSEIGGRSGEGRSGKSAGEFVEEDATGKGGRKTPTRLTPDPFEKGQVNDQSKDPTGGSTGGGKASGAGGGGLEGPVPPQVKAKLKSAAVKQAELRNKAEKINAKFKVMRWPTPFEETVKEMKQVEADLQNARYQSVLRRRPIILKNLKTTRMFLKEQIRINKDYSSSLPKYLQDEILDAAQGGSPRGYEKLLKDYYKSISQKSDAPAAAGSAPR